jgi:hypothetical protein
VGHRSDSYGPLGGPLKRQCEICDLPRGPARRVSRRGWIDVLATCLNSGVLWRSGGLGGRCGAAVEVGRTGGGRRTEGSGVVGVATGTCLGTGPMTGQRFRFHGARARAPVHAERGSEGRARVREEGGVGGGRTGVGGWGAGEGGRRGHNGETQQAGCGWGSQRAPGPCMGQPSRKWVGVRLASMGVSPQFICLRARPGGKRST